MPAQGSVHDIQRAPHQTLGTRTRCRGRADAARSKSASHACAPQNRRASFATLKMRMGATHFLMRTLPKVATEMALHVLAYNLTRVMNIVDIKPLLAAVRA
jgi:hypothetical protein